ncbi:MAG: DEAD/DEAH box helicase [Candidatus Veblenbacteria bacterium]|nr:DEAD/DEAH box helicase [Candidatus Veblenbacteria bacterium]
MTSTPPLTIGGVDFCTVPSDNEFMFALTSPLADIKGVGPTLAKRLAKLNLTTVADLLDHYPSRYEDFSRFARIAELKVGERVTLRGKIQLITSRRAWRRKLSITEALVGDGTGTIKAVWFNQPYLAQTIKPGNEVLLAGMLTSTSYGLQLEHPTIEPIEQGGLHTGRLVPIYPATSQLTQRFLRALVARALPLTKNITDWLPLEVRKPAQLPTLNTAINTLHFPPSREQLQAARRRVAFDELFLIHLKSIQAKRTLHKKQALTIPFSEDTKRLVAALPWALTNDQRQAAWEILKDLGKDQPMFRLLQGDVGSGKTVVAGIACFNCVQAGYQAALLAPTEILAVQHFRTFPNYSRLGLLRWRSLRKDNTG